MGFVKGHADIGATRVVVYGQSLGGAVALYVADKFREDVSDVHHMACCCARLWRGLRLGVARGYGPVRVVLGSFCASLGSRIS
jgi:hypothetical protein